MEVRIARWVGVFDIGTVLNLKTASSQLHLARRESRSHF